MLFRSDYLDQKNGTESIGFDANFAIQYGYSIVVMILCLLSASFIIRCIVTEKDSKLIELLMVSVSPLALLLGKILAVMTYVLIMIAKIKGNDCDSCLNKCAKQCICLLFASYLQMIFAC